jgi:hypothetical protein
VCAPGEIGGAGGAPAGAALAIACVRLGKQPS